MDEEKAIGTESKGKTASNNVKVSKPRRRAPAIIVRVGDAGYEDTLKRIRSGPEIEEANDNITAIRRTRVGDLLVELRNGTPNTDKLRESIKSAVGDTVSTVEIMQAKSRLTVRDLDELATGQEVQEAITSLLGENAVTTVVMTKQPRGQQMAIVTGSVSTIEEILAKGRLRVGCLLQDQSLARHQAMFQVSRNGSLLKGMYWPGQVWLL